MSKPINIIDILLEAYKSKGYGKLIPAKKEISITIRSLDRKEQFQILSDWKEIDDFIEDIHQVVYDYY